MTINIKSYLNSKITLFIYFSEHKLETEVNVNYMSAKKNLLPTSPAVCYISLREDFHNVFHNLSILK